MPIYTGELTHKTDSKTGQLRHTEGVTDDMEVALIFHAQRGLNKNAKMSSNGKVAMVELFPDDANSHNGAVYVDASEMNRVDEVDFFKKHVLDIDSFKFVYYFLKKNRLSELRAKFSRIMPMSNVDSLNDAQGEVLAKAFLGLYSDEEAEKEIYGGHDDKQAVKDALKHEFVGQGLKKTSIVEANGLEFEVVTVIKSCSFGKDYIQANCAILSANALGTNASASGNERRVLQSYKRILSEKNFPNITGKSEIRKEKIEVPKTGIEFRRNIGNYRDFISRIRNEVVREFQEWANKFEAEDLGVSEIPTVNTATVLVHLISELNVAKSEIRFTSTTCTKESLERYNDGEIDAVGVLRENNDKFVQLFAKAIEKRFIDEDVFDTYTNRVIDALERNEKAGIAPAHLQGKVNSAVSKEIHKYVDTITASGDAVELFETYRSLNQNHDTTIIDNVLAYVREHLDEWKVYDPNEEKNKFRKLLSSEISKIVQRAFDHFKSEGDKWLNEHLNDYLEEFDKRADKENVETLYKEILAKAEKELPKQTSENAENIDEIVDEAVKIRKTLLIQDASAYGYEKMLEDELKSDSDSLKPVSQNELSRRLNVYLDSVGGLEQYVNELASKNVENARKALHNFAELLVKEGKVPTAEYVAENFEWDEDDIRAIFSHNFKEVAHKEFADMIQKVSDAQSIRKKNKEIIAYALELLVATELLKGFTDSSNWVPRLNAVIACWGDFKNYPDETAEAVKESFVEKYAEFYQNESKRIAHEFAPKIETIVADYDPSDENPTDWNECVRPLSKEYDGEKIKPLVDKMFSNGNYVQYGQEQTSKFDAKEFAHEIALKSKASLQELLVQKVKEILSSKGIVVDDLKERLSEKDYVAEIIGENGYSIEDIANEIAQSTSSTEELSDLDIRSNALDEFSEWFKTETERALEGKRETCLSWILNQHFGNFYENSSAVDAITAKFDKAYSRFVTNESYELADLEFDRQSDFITNYESDHELTSKDDVKEIVDALKKEYGDVSKYVQADELVYNFDDESFALSTRNELKSFLNGIINMEVKKEIAKLGFNAEEMNVKSTIDAGDYVSKICKRLMNFSDVTDDVLKSVNYVRLDELTVQVMNEFAKIAKQALKSEGFDKLTDKVIESLTINNESLSQKLKARLSAYFDKQNGFETYCNEYVQAFSTNSKETFADVARKHWRATHNLYADSHELAEKCNPESSIKLAFVKSTEKIARKLLTVLLDEAPDEEKEDRINEMAKELPAKIAEIAEETFNDVYGEGSPAQNVLTNWINHHKEEFVKAFKELARRHDKEEEFQDDFDSTVENARKKAISDFEGSRYGTNKQNAMTSIASTYEAHFKRLWNDYVADQGITADWEKATEKACGKPQEQAVKICENLENVEALYEGIQGLNDDRAELYKHDVQKFYDEQYGMDYCTNNPSISFSKHFKELGKTVRNYAVDMLADEGFKKKDVKGVMQLPLNTVVEYVASENSDAIKNALGLEE